MHFSSGLHRRGLLLTAALACLGSFPAPAQSTNATSQVTPGHTATITPTKIVPTPAAAPQEKILDSALTPETRKTLQEAMKSPATTNDASKPAPPAK